MSPSRRDQAAWWAEQQRLRRERRAYWLGMGEIYLQFLAFTLLTLAAIAATSKGSTP